MFLNSWTLTRPSVGPGFGFWQSKISYWGLLALSPHLTNLHHELIIQYMSAPASFVLALSQIHTGTHSTLTRPSSWSRSRCLCAKIRY